MPAAARVGDATAHPGVLAGPGAPTVLVEGRPAATIGTLHTCMFPPPAGPHPPTPVLPPGSATVFICGQPAARVGDLTGCGAPIITGAPTVVIGA
ncbi:PAAR domain-containing protein [Kribbella sp. CA-253562]|uniref:PAAR domain-containing protein n=1 Tax=Kribbella sp. CA-253562 TaxID=3239942 RepID=UPI003D8E8117